MKKKPTATDLHTHGVWDRDYHGVGSECHEIVFSGSKAECESYISDNNRFYIEKLRDDE